MNIVSVSYKLVLYKPEILTILQIAIYRSQLYII